MAGGTTRASDKTYRLAIVLLVSMFAIWGLAHRLYDTLLPGFATALSLNDYQANLAQWILSLGYGLMAIPAAMLTRNFGYKSGVVFGLGCFAIGMFLFYPAAEQHAFLFLLSAALVVGCGLALLAVSADPLIVRWGPAESAVRRLNLAQTFNPAGTLLGFFMGRWIVQSNLQHPIAQLANALVLPYSCIGAGVLLFAVLVDNIDFPPVARERVSKDDRTVKSFTQLFSRPLFMLGAVALFLCSASQVVLWGFAIRYAQSAVSGLSLASAADILLWSLIAFTVGRVVGTALMYWFNPSWLLAIFAGAGAVLATVAALAGGQLGVECIVGASFFLSIVFPTIFASSIRDIGPLTKSGSAFLMLAAGSGAAALAITNLLSGTTNIQYVMLVPSVGFALIAAFAVVYHYAADSKLRAPEAASPIGTSAPAAK